MLVSHKYKFIYIKTPKTAGTSVEIFLERYCRPDPENIREGCEELISEVGIVALRTNDKERLARATFWNHMSAKAIKDALGAEIWDSYTKVCNVRNPFDLVVSQFWMATPLQVRKNLQNQDIKSIRQKFKPWVLGRNIARKIRNISFIDNRFPANRWIRYEFLENDVRALCAELGMEFGEIGQYKGNIRLNKTPFQSYYDEETAAAVQSGFDLEFQQFGYDPESWKKPPP